MTNTNKARGTRFEREVADYLDERLQADVDRMPLRGVDDRGDISGVRSAFGERIAVECKQHSRLDLAGWYDEASVEARNYGAPVAVVIHKRRGIGAPGAQWVTMTVSDLVRLIAKGDATGA